MRSGSGSVQILQITYPDPSPEYLVLVRAIIWFKKNEVLFENMKLHVAKLFDLKKKRSTIWEYEAPRGLSRTFFSTWDPGKKIAFSHLLWLLRELRNGCSGGGGGGFTGSPYQWIFGKMTVGNHWHRCQVKIKKFVLSDIPSKRVISSLTYNFVIILKNF